jgi:hypothetical protein
MTTIEKIEALRSTYNAMGANELLDQVIEILKAQKTIKAKAVRSRKDKKWVWLVDGKWEKSEGELPDIYFNGVLNEDYIPVNAELIDITIIVEEP